MKGKYMSVGGERAKVARANRIIHKHTSYIKEFDPNTNSYVYNPYDKKTL